jgi:hypothetical protein
MAVKQSPTKAGREFAQCIGDVGGLVAGDVVEVTDERVQRWPLHFCIGEFPLLRSELDAARQRISADMAAAAANRREVWAEAERRDREAAALQAAEEAEREVGVRARWSRYFEGTKA